MKNSETSILIIKLLPLSLFSEFFQSRIQEHMFTVNQKRKLGKKSSAFDFAAELN